MFYLTKLHPAVAWARPVPGHAKAPILASAWLAVGHPGANSSSLFKLSNLEPKDPSISF